MPDLYYETRFTHDPGRAKVWRAICEDLQRHIDPGGVVCDLGCGYGDFINTIRAREKLAVDTSSESARHLDPSVRFLQTRADDLSGIGPHTVDVVFASNLLEHLDDEELSRTLAEVRRVLRPGGTFIALQPNYRYCYREYFDDYTHKKVLSHISLSDLLAAEGFEPVQVRPRYLPLSFKSVFPKSYWLTKLYLGLRIGFLGKQMLMVCRRR